MKSRTFIVMFAALLLLLLASTASAHGLDTEKLENAGWDCSIAGPHGWVHCFPPGAPMTKGKATTVKVFDCQGPSCTVGEEGAFDGVGHPFLGTELLIHSSVYNDQGCATDGGEAYHPVETPIGVFYACHHFDTSHDD